MLLFTLVYISSASAESSSPSANQWTVQSRSGEVFFASARTDEWQNPEARQVLSASFTIRTGATGETVLVRGEDALLIAPESRIEVQGAEHSTDSGLVTRIPQAIGSLVYQVERM